jgi:hypothetical protein
MGSCFGHRKYAHEGIALIANLHSIDVAPGLISGLGGSFA